MMFLAKIWSIFVIGFLLFNLHLNPQPKLFVIGDSISIQYGPYLEKYLEGIYEYDRKRDEGADSSNLDVPKGANGGDSGMVLAYLKAKLKTPDFQPDIVLINCGLHDIKTNVESGKKQVALASYKENLEQIHALLANKGIPMIWVRTTPVDDEQHNSKQQSFHRYAADVANYNEVADKVFGARSVPIIDLHQFTLNLGEGLFTDHVHFGEDTRAKQAAFISGFLQGLAFKN
ncbi:SGNH/GDSL hydrolase family protein [Cyclobacterium amurskyense]|uniref:Lipolytic protein G-D-S-L family n=1 Tax=Cyclobacterium amurskyense TaxID=320787 RepID=A0A0H4PFR3_9BACT|nr:SGNH/GDSL hydrolase family protein [Cyclobacterium amurskyense]AKP53054.1 Lipolytic protein G-D-S-L family [Cyclobacterium amurskyense]|tara:strand:- start:1299 stop:1991 length:693 start_codon:yes stop_codon:yes gene_type:complete